MDVMAHGLKQHPVVRPFTVAVQAGMREIQEQGLQSSSVAQSHLGVVANAQLDINEQLQKALELVHTQAK